MKITGFSTLEYATKRGNVAAALQPFPLFGTSAFGRNGGGVF